MSEKLLTCPFCGGEPEFQESNPYDASDDTAYTVFCRGCGTEHPWRDTPEDAVSFWNRREGILAGDWMPVETAPHEVNVLLAWPDRTFSGGWMIEAGMASWGWRRDGVSNMSEHGQATHWMRLPAPPKGDV